MRRSKCLHLAIALLARSTATPRLSLGSYCNQKKREEPFYVWFSVIDNDNDNGGDPLHNQLRFSQALDPYANIASLCLTPNVFFR